MSDMSLFEELTAIHEGIRVKVEAHFNKDQEYQKYKVERIVCRSETEYASRLGDTEYIHASTDVSFDVRLADVARVVNRTAIYCTVRIKYDGELSINNVQYQYNISL